MSWFSSLTSEINCNKLIQIYQNVQSIRGTTAQPNPADLVAQIKKDLRRPSPELHGAILDCLLVLLAPSSSSRLKEEASPVLSEVLIKLVTIERPLRKKKLKCLCLLPFTDSFVQEHMVQLVSLLTDAIVPPGASIIKATQLMNRLLKDHTALMLSEARHWINIFASLLVEEAEGVQRITANWLRLYTHHLAPMADDLGSILCLKDEYLQSHLLQMMSSPGKEIHALRVWAAIILLFGKELHNRVPLVNLFMQVIHHGFMSPKEDVHLEAMSSWRKLIANFAAKPEVISSIKRLKLLLNPLQKESKTEGVVRAKISTWWYLVTSLTTKINGVPFEMVVVPLLKMCLNSRISVTRAAQQQNETLMKLQRRLGSELLCRLLEAGQKPQRLRSPKKQVMDIKPLKSPVHVELLVEHQHIILASLNVALNYLLEPKTSPSNQLGSSQLLQYLLQVFLFRLGEIPSSLEGRQNFIATGLKLVLSHAPNLPLVVLIAVVEEVSLLPTDILANPRLGIGADSRSDLFGPCIHFLRLLLQEFEDNGCTEQSLEPFRNLISASARSTQRPLDLLCSILPGLGKSFAPLVWSCLCTVATECIRDVEVSLHVPGNLNLLLSPFSTFLQPPPSLSDAQLNAVMAKWGPLYHGLSQLAAAPNLVCFHVCSKLLQLVSEEHLKIGIVYSAVSTIILSAIIQALELADPKNPSPELSVQSSTSIQQQLERTGPFIQFFGRTFAAFRANLEAGQIRDADSHMEMWIHRMEFLLPKLLGTSQALALLRSVVPVLAHLASSNWSHIHSSLLPKMELLLSTLYKEIQCCPSIEFSGELLTILSPLLEVSLSHSRRTLVEKARTFWNSCFAKLDSVPVPTSLRECVKKMKSSPILLPSPQPNKAAATPMLPSVTTPKTTTPNQAKITTLTTPCSSHVQKNLYSFLTPKSSKKHSPEENENFVKIQPKSLTKRRILTEHQKEKRRERSFVPTMYNDLSQDSQPSQTPSTEDSAEFKVPAPQPPAENCPGKIVGGVVDSEMAIDEPSLQKWSLEFSPFSRSPLNLQLSRDDEVIPSSQANSPVQTTSAIIAKSLPFSPSIVLEPLPSDESPAILVPESPPKDTANLPDLLSCPETEELLLHRPDALSPPPTRVKLSPPESSPLPRNRRVRRPPTKFSPCKRTARKSVSGQVNALFQSRKRKGQDTLSSFAKKPKIEDPKVDDDSDDDIPLSYLRNKASESQDCVVKEIQEIPPEPMETTPVEEASQSILEPRVEAAGDKKEEDRPEKDIKEEAWGKENLMPPGLNDAEEPALSHPHQKSPVKITPLQTKVMSPTPPNDALKKQAEGPGYLPAGLRKFSNLERGQKMVNTAIFSQQMTSPKTTKAVHSPQKTPTIHTYSPLASPSSSILKKNETPKKASRVSFSEPLVLSQIEFERAERYEFRAPPRPKKSSVVAVQKQLQSEEDKPVFPQLVHCKDSVSELLSELAFGSIRGLNQVLTSRKIHTVGSLANLNAAEVNQLPIRNPKVPGLLNVLKAHLTQKHSASPSTPVKTPVSPIKTPEKVSEECSPMPSEITPSPSGKLPVPESASATRKSAPQEAMEVDDVPEQEALNPSLNDNGPLAEELQESEAKLSSGADESSPEHILSSGSEEFVPPPLQEMPPPPSPEEIPSTPQETLFTPQKEPSSPPQSKLSTPQEATSTPQEAISTPQEAISTPQEATSTSQEATYTPQKATSTPQEATSTPQGATSTPQGATSTPQEATSNPRGATSSPQEATSTPREATSTPQEATSTPRGATSTLQEAPSSLQESASVLPKMPPSIVEPLQEESMEVDQPSGTEPMMQAEEVQEVPSLVDTDAQRREFLLKVFQEVASSTSGSFKLPTLSDTELARAMTRIEKIRSELHPEIALLPESNLKLLKRELTHILWLISIRETSS